VLADELPAICAEAALDSDAWVSPIAGPAARFIDSLDEAQS